MKVIVSVQSKRGSSCGLVHYLAHSKIDTSKEPCVSRELFNSYTDSIDVTKSNIFLKSGTSNKRPSNDELHHLVISLKPEDYEKLGVNEKERRRSVKEITRHALNKLERAIGADKLTWAASIHRNTPNPHVHIGLQKQFFNQNLEKRSLGKIPRECLPHYAIIGGEKTFLSGVLIDAAMEKLDEIVAEKSKVVVERSHSENGREKSRDSGSTAQPENAPKAAENTENNSYDRDVLARAQLAKYFLERSEERLESIVKNGPKRRFVIFDAMTGQKRRMSLFDLERRAEEGAFRELRKLEIKDAGKIAELKKNFIESELDQNLNSIRRIRTILLKTAAREEGTRQQRETAYNLVRPEAEKIRASYRRENKKLPAPSLTKDEIDLIQDQSLANHDIRATNYYERIRTELVGSGEIPARTKEDIQRLKALQVVQELRLRLHQEKLNSFKDRRHFEKFEISSENWSLARIDESIKKGEKTDLKFLGTIKKVFRQEPFAGNEYDRAHHLEIRRIVIEKLEDKSRELTRERQSERNTTKTLESILKSDPGSGIEVLNPKFNAEQLAEIESLAFHLRLPEMYEQNWHDQTRFIAQASYDSAAAHSKSTPQFDNEKSLTLRQESVIAGRSIARQIMCEIELAKTTDALTHFRKNKYFHKFEVPDEKTGDSRFVNLKEVEFRRNGSIFDQAIEYLTENRERRRTRNALKSIVKEKHATLKSEVREASRLLEIASKETGAYKTKTLFGVNVFTQNPIFTPQETAALDLRIKRTESKAEAGKLQTFLDLRERPDAGSLSQILNNFSDRNETIEYKEAEIIHARSTGEEAAITERSIDPVQRESGGPKSPESELKNPGRRIGHPEVRLQQEDHSRGTGRR